MSELGYKIGRKLIEWDMDFRDWRSMQHDARMKRKKNRKDKCQQRRDWRAKLHEAQTEVDIARREITEMVSFGEKRPEACFVRYNYSDLSDSREETRSDIDVPKYICCEYLDEETGLCTRKYAEGEEECSKKTQKISYDIACKKLYAVESACRDAFWERVSINGVRIDKYFLLAKDIRRKRRYLNHVRNKKLDKFEAITAVPVNRDDDIEMNPKHRSHCVFMYICTNKPKNECPKYYKPKDSSVQENPKYCSDVYFIKELCSKYDDKNKDVSLGKLIDNISKLDCLAEKQEIKYAKMYSTTVVPIGEEGEKYADFSQKDDETNPVVTVYECKDGQWVQSDVIAMPLAKDGYVSIINEVWDVPELKGRNGAKVVWTSNEGQFTAYPIFCAGLKANIAYTRQKRKLAYAEGQYNDLLEQRRVMRSQLLGRTK